MVDHNVVGLDVTVDDADNLMAVVKGINEIDKILPDFTLLQSNGPHILIPLLLFALFIVRLKLLVKLNYLVAKATF